MIRKAHLSLILLPFLAIACPGETGGSGSAGGGTVPAPGSAGSGSFVVIFDGQSAMNDPNPNFKVVNPPATTVDALPAPPTKTHFTFGGWFTTKNGSGTPFLASTNVSGNMTVYAKWDPILTVKIGNLLWKKCAEGQANDGSCTGMPKYYQYCTDGVPSNCFNGTTLFTGPIYDACNALNSNPPGGLAGKTTWRVPTLAESMAATYCSNGWDAANQICNAGSAAPTLDPTSFPEPCLQLVIGRSISSVGGFISMIRPPELIPQVKMKQGWGRTIPNLWTRLDYPMAGIIFAASLTIPDLPRTDAA